MKKLNYFAIAMFAAFAISCSNDNETPPVVGTSDTDLLVATFDAAPTFDGEIDDMWNSAQKLVSEVTVPAGQGARNTYYNEDGIGEESLDIFEAYEGESYPFTMRAGTFGSDMYFLIEWEDAIDSKDRQSWYFDAGDKLWKQEHKYANDGTDKFYEDKFAFLFPIGEVDNFSTSTCYASCHGPASIEKTGDKNTRHYLKTAGQKIDMWHWKRVRGTHNDRVDDQRITAVDQPWTSSSNGRSGDPGGDETQSGYSDNIIKDMVITGTSTVVRVPKYVIPNETDYYWIPEADLGTTAKLVTAVDANGVLTLDGGGTIDPTGDAGYNQATGNKRFPSILTRDFTGNRADIEIKATHTGAGWVCELKRKLNTGDEFDVVFDPATELDFGFAVFNNAAIGHAIKPGLKLKWQQ